MAYRLPAEWMQATDDRILEWLDTEGVTTPKTLAEEGPWNYHRKTIQRRLKKLQKAGLTERVGRGVYRISNDGIRYLHGEEDLRGTPEPE